jgi:hypothetical protein
MASTISERSGYWHADDHAAALNDRLADPPLCVEVYVAT